MFVFYFWFWEKRSENMKIVNLTTDVKATNDIHTKSIFGIFLPKSESWRRSQIPSFIFRILNIVGRAVQLTTEENVLLNTIKWSDTMIKTKADSGVQLPFQFDHWFYVELVSTHIVLVFV